MNSSSVSLLDRLPVMESFYTIQGEGFHSGKAAYFIRLGGCDVGCHWCDVKESWDASAHPSVTVDELARRASEFSSKIVVITGGEPLMYDLTLLCEALHKAGLKTHLETSGAYPLTGKWDWVCVSPKKFKKPLSEVIRMANELKVIVYNKSDFGWAESFIPLLSRDCRLFLQPEWSKNEKIVPFLVNYVKQHPRWQISLQTHKYLKIP